MSEVDKKAKRAAYMRLWRINNPEKARVIDARARAKKVDAHKVLAKQWYEKNKELTKNRSKEWYANNKQRHYESGKAWRLANPDKCYLFSRKWRQSNKDAVTSLTRKRQAKQLKAMPEWANEFFIKEAYHLAKQREKLTGFVWHVDHIVPLQHESVCGLHCEFNLRVIPAVSNIKKSNSWADNVEYGIYQ